MKQSIICHKALIWLCYQTLINMDSIISLLLQWVKCCKVDNSITIYNSDSFNHHHNFIYSLAIISLQNYSIFVIDNQFCISHVHSIYISNVLKWILKTVKNVTYESIIIFSYRISNLQTTEIA